MQVKIKVINILTTIQDGGMETLVYRIYNGLNSNKYEFSVLSLTPLQQNYLTDKFRGIDCNVFDLNFKNKNLTKKEWVRNLGEFFKLAKMFRQNKYDVIHSHDFFSAAITRFALRYNSLRFSKASSKVYVTLHNLLTWLSEKHHKINRQLAERTNKIICVSNSVKNFSKEHDKISEEKYSVIYNGIDENAFYKDTSKGNELKNYLNIPDNAFVIGNIGTLSVRKGHKYLIEAFSGFAQSVPDARLIVAGGTRGHEKDVESEIESLINKHSLNDKVIMLEAAENVLAVYNMMDMYVMSSITEGFSLAALEAMLTERICIFSDIGPFLELAEEGKTGFFFKTKDSNDLQRVMKNVYSNYSGNKHIGINARQSVIDKFSYTKMISEYDKLYSAG